MNKQVLRDLYLEKRLTLTSSEYERRNLLLKEHCISFLERHEHQRNCHIFLTIEEKKEVNTKPIIQWLQSSSNHTAHVPKISGKGKLNHLELLPETELRKNKWGIPEPVNSKAIEASELNIVFVPLICFDLKGQRIGYGAGFYDQFLIDTNKNCLKVGLSIAPPLDNIDYAENHDIPLDFCISHAGLYSFNSSSSTT